MTSRDYPVHPFARTIVLVITLIFTGALSIKFLNIAANFPEGILGDNIIENGLVGFQATGLISVIIFNLFLHFKASKWRVYIDKGEIRCDDKGKGKIRISYPDVTQVVLPDFSSLFGHSLTVVSGSARLELVFIEFEETIGRIINGLGEAGYEFDEARLRRFQKTRVFGQRRVRRIHRLLAPLVFATMLLVTFMVLAIWGVGMSAALILVVAAWSLTWPLMGWVVSEVLLGRAFQRGSYAQPDSTREENFSTECHYFTVGYALAAGLMVVGYGALLAVF